MKKNDQICLKDQWDVANVPGWGKMYYEQFDDLKRWDSRFLLGYLIDMEGWVRQRGRCCTKPGYENYLRYADSFIQEKFTGITNKIIRALLDDLETHNYIEVFHYGNLGTTKGERYIKLNYKKIRSQLGLEEEFNEPSNRLSNNPSNEPSNIPSNDPSNEQKVKQNILSKEQTIKNINNNRVVEEETTTTTLVKSISEDITSKLSANTNTWLNKYMDLNLQPVDKINRSLEVLLDNYSDEQINLAIKEAYINGWKSFHYHENANAEIYTEEEIRQEAEKLNKIISSE